MSQVSLNDLKELRRRTAAGVMECRQALEATGGDMERATEYVRQKAIAEAVKRANRPAREGLVGSYIHHTGKLGAFVEVNCESDFVARTDAFRSLVERLAEHVAAAAPLAVDRETLPEHVVADKRRELALRARAAGASEEEVEQIVGPEMDAFFHDVALLDQAWVREPDQTIGELIKATSTTLGERIAVRRFSRFRVGEE